MKIDVEFDNEKGEHFVRTFNVTAYNDLLYEIHELITTAEMISDCTWDYTIPNDAELELLRIEDDFDKYMKSRTPEEIEKAIKIANDAIDNDLPF
jgi:hypothetical protein